MAFKELSPIQQVTEHSILRLCDFIQSILENPFEITRLAVSTGETARRFACCIKLICLYSQKLPLIEFSTHQPLSADLHNLNFEKELTVSKIFPSMIFTAIFSCLLASIGAHPLRIFMVSPCSPDLFVQCCRIVFRWTWIVRCCWAALRGLRELDGPCWLLFNQLKPRPNTHCLSTVEGSEQAKGEYP
jgi:hypothetical protein